MIRGTAGALIFCQQPYVLPLSVINFLSSPQLSWSTHLGEKAKARQRCSMQTCATQARLACSFSFREHHRIQKCTLGWGWLLGECLLLAMVSSSSITYPVSYFWSLSSLYFTICFWSLFYHVSYDFTASCNKNNRDRLISFFYFWNLCQE
jgi:hypothetical protein